LKKILLEIPIQEMADLAERNDIRFIYLFIPSDSQPLKSIENRQTVLQLQSFMKMHHIEYIDFVMDLTEGEDASESKRFKQWKKEKVEELIQKGGTSQRNFWQQISPATTLRHIGQWKVLQKRHTSQHFMDITHLSRKGHQQVAKRIIAYLRDHEHSFTP